MIKKYVVPMFIFVQNWGALLAKVCDLNIIYYYFNFVSLIVNKFYSFIKVVDLPPNLEFLQFTCINKLQTHLMSLDLQNGCFNSVIVKITLDNIFQYRFQERVQKQSLGLVKISHRNNNYSIIEGKNTRFEKNVQSGENIIIMGEKHCVL